MLSCMLDALHKYNQWNIQKAYKFQLQRGSNILLAMYISELLHGPFFPPISWIALACQVSVPWETGTYASIYMDGTTISPKTSL